MERIGNEVERELARRGSRSTSALTSVVAAWRAAVGESVARNAWPARIGRDGTLHVATSSATWAYELDRLGPDIARALEQEIGPAAPRKLRFAVGLVPEPDAIAETETEPVTPVRATPRVVAEAASAAASIEDPELRMLMARAARASLARRSSDRHF